MTGIRMLIVGQNSVQGKLSRESRLDGPSYKAARLSLGAMTSLQAHSRGHRRRAKGQRASREASPLEAVTECP
jgi:hypothetical protein